MVHLVEQNRNALFSQAVFQHDANSDYSRRTGRMFGAHLHVVFHPLNLILCAADEKGERLGKGEYGTVYRAQRKVTGQDVAMKIIPKHASKGPSNSTARRPEVELTAQVNSDYVLKILECYDTAKCVYLIMELCDGGSLKGQMRSRNKSAHWYCEEVCLFQICLMFLICTFHCNNCLFRKCVT
jgi:serine/threonine protein kinase